MLPRDIELKSRLAGMPEGEVYRALSGPTYSLIQIQKICLFIFWHNFFTNNFVYNFYFLSNTLHVCTYMYTYTYTYWLYNVYLYTGKWYVGCFMICYGVCKSIAH